MNIELSDPSKSKHKHNKMQRYFEREHYDKFDAALDLLFTRGYRNEIKYQDPKMIGDILLQYSILRIDPSVKNPRFGDIMVKMTLQGVNCNLEFCCPINGKLQTLDYKEILALPAVD